MEGEPRTVFAHEVAIDELDAAVFSAAPFLAQEVLSVDEHYRVVTVQENVWVGSLDATGLPLDWRREVAAHGNFVSTSPGAEPELERNAVRVAAHLGLGYSSQDWVRCGGERYLLDVNPGGQWLFLPAEIADRVTEAIASWLVGDSE